MFADGDPVIRLFADGDPVMRLFADGDPVVRRLTLTNFDDLPIQYEMSWPAHCISVRPEQGTVTSRGTCVICVCANPLLRNKSVQVPWNGNMHVTVGNKSQVRVT